MEQNQNSFDSEAAVAGAADEALPRPSATPFTLASAQDAPGACSGDPPSILDFDPVMLRHRTDGWTLARQRAFIEELADCGVVREAAARVGMTERSANYLRRRAAARAFGLAWEAAIQMGADRLRSIAYERAVAGTVKQHYYRGEVVGEERVFDNRLLIYLLGKAQPAVNPLDAGEIVRDWDRWMQAVEDGLDKPMPAPDDSVRSPVWEAEDGNWWTSFPPPPGFNGNQAGASGEPDYRRECTLDEIAAVQADRAREKDEQGRRRDLYFGRMK